MKKLYKYELDCGRMGSLEGIFVADTKEITAALGKTCYFGEVLGKHSDISETLEESQLEVLTTDSDFIKKAEKYGLVPSGFNPLDYLPEEE